MITLKDTPIINNDAINEQLINTKASQSRLNNTIAQLGALIPGSIQGTAKSLGAIGILKESIDNMVRDKGQASSLKVKNEAVNAFNSGNSYKYFTNKANLDAENWANSWIPPPMSPEAEFLRTAADSTGEAVPMTAIGVATGGTLLGGNLLSYGLGAANAFSSEMLEGSGDLGKSVIRAGTAYASEKIGGKVFDSITPTKGPLSITIGSIGEGLEGIGDSGLYSFITGEQYTLQDAKRDFAYGAAAGAALGGGAQLTNFVRNEVKTRVAEADIRRANSSSPGALQGLRQSIDLTKAKPETYGVIASAISTPAVETRFDAGQLSDYMRSAIRADRQARVETAGNTFKSGLQTFRDAVKSPIQTIGNLATEAGKNIGVRINKAENVVKAGLKGVKEVVTSPISTSSNIANQAKDVASQRIQSVADSVMQAVQTPSFDTFLNARRTIDAARQNVTLNTPFAGYNQAKADLKQELKNPLVSSPLKSFLSTTSEAIKTIRQPEVRVPRNLRKIDAANVGSYHTVLDPGARDPAWGMRNTASILESAQLQYGLTPRQSGRIARAVVETNAKLYSDLNRAGVQSGARAEGEPVEIVRGQEYRASAPQSGEQNTHLLLRGNSDITGTQNDRPVNVFRGMSSEWIIPTLEAGRYTIPNATPDVASESNRTSLFGSRPGQMLGAGLYLTSVPSKADQYTSGVKNPLSIEGYDSRGIMKHSVLLGGTTYINEAELARAESGKSSNTVKMGTLQGNDQKSLARFVNANAGNPEAAAIYSNRPEFTYTEIVRPTADKTSVDRVYLPLDAIDSQMESIPAQDGSTAEKAGVGSTVQAEEAGRQRAASYREDTQSVMGNADADPVLERYFGRERNAPAVRVTDVPQRSELADNREQKSTEKTGAIESSREIQRVERERVVRPNTGFSFDTESAQVGKQAASVTPLSVETVKTVGTGRHFAGLSSVENKSTQTGTPKPTASQLNTSQQRQSQQNGPNNADLPRSIWTPSQTQNPNTANAKQNTQGNRYQRRERELPTYDFNLFRGSGATGRVFETDRYNTTFGALSSY